MAYPYIYSLKYIKITNNKSILPKHFVNSFSLYTYTYSVEYLTFSHNGHKKLSNITLWGHNMNISGNGN